MNWKQFLKPTKEKILDCFIWFLIIIGSPIIGAWSLFGIPVFPSIETIIFVGVFSYFGSCMYVYLKDYWRRLQKDREKYDKELENLHMFWIKKAPFVGITLLLIGLPMFLIFAQSRRKTLGEIGFGVGVILLSMSVSFVAFAIYYKFKFKKKKITLNEK